jgi:caspase domain-containing protein
MAEQALYQSTRQTKLFEIGPLLGLLAMVLFFAPERHSTAQVQQDNRQLSREQAQQSNSPSERRIALVIGNGTYTNAPTLKNPPNDARDMATTLKALGFEVTSGINVNQREMKSLIRDFGQKLKSGGSGLFYYAGHGVQSKGQNYLIPIEADIQSEVEVEDAGVDVNLVLGYMDDAQNGLNIVILDACRDNPFARSFRSASGGLAQVDAPTGTLIAYATAPGRVASDGTGRNGLYTSELLKQMRAPGVPVTEMFMRVRAEVIKQTSNKQVPWEASSLVGTFYFTVPPKGNSSTQTSAAMNETKIDPVAVEREYWETIRNSKDAQDFEGYLQTYPNGAYATIARTKINQINARSNGKDLKTESNEAADNKTSPKIRNNRSVSVALASMTQFAVIGENPPPVFLQVGGEGWDGGSEVKVFLNREEITIPVESQKDGHITFHGSVEQLHARDGRNEVFVEVNGVRSNTYVFRQAVTIGPVAKPKYDSRTEDIAATSADWQPVRGDGFSIRMPKGSMSEDRQSLYNGGRVNRMVYRTPIGQRPFLGVISASGINARASRPSDAEKLDSYVDAFKYWLPEAVFGRGQPARLTLIGENTLGGNAGREYQVTVGDMSGFARVYFSGGRFVIAVALEVSADQSSQFFNSLTLR